MNALRSGPSALVQRASSPFALSSATAVELRQKWRILASSQLGQRCEELGGGSYLIEGLIPQRSISIVVGDSGLGKSPLLYQAALCVAAGLPLLGHGVCRGRVLFLDFENGLSEVEDLLTRLAAHLRLPSKPGNLLLWNYNDASPTWKNSDLRDMIRDTRPVWTIIDSLSGYSPEIEEKASYATRVQQEFRKVIREFGTSVTGVHHIRKPSSKPEEAPPPLEEDPHRWFLQARGSRALINGSDVRLGVAPLRMTEKRNVWWRAFRLSRRKESPIGMGKQSAKHNVSE